MEISLRERTAAHVVQYFNNTQNSTIQNMLPQTVHTVEVALENFDRSTRPDSTSYGRTIYVDEMYVGDVWCCSIDKHSTPQAMLSYCIFEKQYWGKGIATSAVKLFLSDFRLKYGVTVVGAYTYSTNIASIRVLEHCGFKLENDFLEDGILSYYFLLDSRPSIDALIASAKPRTSPTGTSGTEADSVKVIEKGYPSGIPTLKIAPER